jgi:putative membrane protein
VGNNEAKEWLRMTDQPRPNELRDHLANERTFLSWVRTAIAIVALGFVVAKSGILLREVGAGHVQAETARAGAVVGVILVFAGMLIAVLGAVRFWQIRQDIDRGVVRFSPSLDVVLAIVVAVTSIMLAIYLIATS